MGDTNLPVRSEIVTLSQQGLTDAQIAQRLELSPYTVRKWRRRYPQQGKSELTSPLGRPASGVLSTFSPSIVSQLSSWRMQHPGWGPKTLHAEFGFERLFPGERLPSRASIARWLKATRQVQAYEKHSHLPHKELSPTQACHEEWELDARGYERIPEIGLISLIDLNDVFSRVKLLSYPCWLGQKKIEHFARTDDYQQALRLAFTYWGLPDRLATDHDRIFYDETSQSPFPTRFHLWLVALGIELAFGRMRQPRDQAVTERSHQTWDKQVLQGSCFEQHTQLWTALEQRRTFLNQYLPCASCGDQPPLVAHPEARLPRREYRLEWEAQLLDLERVKHYLAQGHWWRKVSRGRSISIGRHIYSLGKAFCPEDYLELTFDPQANQFEAKSGSDQSIQLPVPWLSVEELMGTGQLAYPASAYQLALPFSWQEWRAWQITIRPAISTPGTT